MLTAKDINLLKEVFLTKNEFMAEMANHPTRQELTDFRQEVKNDTLNFKDEILTEIVELRQETDVNSSFRSKIEKQDKRIERLETAVFS